MLAFRLLLILTAAAIAICAAGYLLGGDRRYLRWAVKILQLAGAAGLVFFAVLMLERLA
ncbi:MAG: hypothetical protein KA778_08620 [Burkholderiaceae bacterium]|jgi:hypothetical protein|nr:hypothetical protein [Burkholderiaceae bacterium]MBP7660054.1 hypothetical protein [Burkholderiaceae bacterium]